MKKTIYFILFMIVMVTIAHSQVVIEDFEHITLNVMTSGETDASSMSVVANPDKGDANPSDYVVRFERDMDGIPWGGFYSLLPSPIDFSSMKYVHVKVWRPRASPVKMKIEGGTTANIEIEPMVAATATEEWESLVFHFNTATGTYTTLVFMPDFAEPVALDEDIVIYFDDFVLSDNVEPGAGNQYVIEDFEFIPMNLMAGDETDTSNFSIVPNPDKDDVNPSEHVVRFERSQHGVPWGGFWSLLPEPLNLTENKYVYVKVWKPRTSVVKFKVEGGPSANLEIESMSPQALTNAWEELVFNFSEKTGTWTTIAFMPDFNDPVNLTEDLVLYFDDIRVGQAPTVNVPLTDTGNAAVRVFPNPATQYIRVTHAATIRSVEVFDVTGRVVQRALFGNANDVVVNFSDAFHGIYIIRITSDSGVSNHKIRINY
jgi:hypothetical protein